MTKDEALKLALEALKPLVRRAAPWGEQDWLNGCKAITVIKEALAESEQEPVAHDNCRAERICRSWCGNFACVSHYADTTPPQRKPLTPEQFNHMPELFVIPPHHVEMVVRTIEAAHGIKE